MKKKVELIIEWENDAHAACAVGHPDYGVIGYLEKMPGEHSGFRWAYGFQRETLSVNSHKRHESLEASLERLYFEFVMKNLIDLRWKEA